MMRFVSRFGSLDGIFDTNRGKCNDSDPAGPCADRDEGHLRAFTGSPAHCRQLRCYYSSAANRSDHHAERSTRAKVS